MSFSGSTGFDRASERVAAGFALAATIARDPGAAAARAGLALAVVESLTHTARELAAMGKEERRARVRELAHTAMPALPAEARRPERAFAVLSRTLRRAHKPQWLQSAALPRAGYAPDPQLVALLARIFAKEEAAQRLAANAAAVVPARSDASALPGVTR